MTKEINEYTMVFAHYERVKSSIYSRIHCRNVRTTEGVLLQDNICLEIDIAKKIIGHLGIGEIMVFSAELAFKNIEFKHPHGITQVRDK